MIGVVVGRVALCEVWQAHDIIALRVTQHAKASLQRACFSGSTVPDPLGLRVNRCGHFLALDVGTSAKP